MGALGPEWAHHVRRHHRRRPMRGVATGFAAGASGGARPGRRSQHLPQRHHERQLDQRGRRASAADVGAAGARGRVDANDETTALSLSAGLARRPPKLARWRAGVRGCATPQAAGCAARRGGGRSWRGGAPGCRRRGVALGGRAGCRYSRARRHGRRARGARAPGGRRRRIPLARRRLGGRASLRGDRAANVHLLQPLLGGDRRQRPGDHHLFPARALRAHLSDR